MDISRKKGALYLQIKNILKDRILHGVYPIGANIPSEPQLEEEFKVSKITVRNAVKALVQEGFLETKSGKGTKVLRNAGTLKLSKGKRFTEVLVEEGHRIRKQWLRTDVVSNHPGTEPCRLFGNECLRIERLYYLDDEPYIHYTHYLSAELYRPDLPDFSAQSLYDFIEEHGVLLDRFRDEFAVAPAPNDVAERLLIQRDTPLLKRWRYSYDERGEVIEYSEGFYHTNKQHYVVNYDV